MTQTARVLLIDDDETVRQSLERALILEHFGVVAAANSEEALRGFAENSIDVVLLDQNLGRESGWDTVEQLRNIRPGLPVIIMTARLDQRAASSARGVEAVMEKPLDLPLLFGTLRGLAAQVREERCVAGGSAR